MSRLPIITRTVSPLNLRLSLPNAQPQFNHLKGNEPEFLGYCLTQKVIYLMPKIEKTLSFMRILYGIVDLQTYLKRRHLDPPLAILNNLRNLTVRLNHFHQMVSLLGKVIRAILRNEQEVVTPLHLRKVADGLL